jgi:hypothetical protein
MTMRMLTISGQLRKVYRWSTPEDGGAGAVGEPEGGAKAMEACRLSSRCRRRRLSRPGSDVSTTVCGRAWEASRSEMFSSADSHEKGEGRVSA